MSTITQLKAADDVAIRNQTAPNSVTRSNTTDRLAAYADEIRARGMHIAANTAALASLAGADSDKVYVVGEGLFKYSVSGTANGVTIFAGTDGFWTLQDTNKSFYSGPTGKKMFHIDNSVSSGIVFDAGGAFDSNFIMHQGISVNGGVHAIDFRNLSAGSSAGLGFAMRNDTGAFLQVQKGSSTYSIFPGGTLIRDSASGFLHVTPGTHNWGSSAAIASAYATLDGTTMNFKTQAIKSVQPSANGAGAWKLGKILGGDGAGAAAFIEVDIDGVLYVLTAKAKV
jgi:hypothetical protein